MKLKNTLNKLAGKVALVTGGSRGLGAVTPIVGYEWIL